MNHFLAWIKYAMEPFLKLAYPSSCLHCNDGLFKPSGILCEPCKELFSPLEIDFRCQYCYDELPVNTRNDQKSNQKICAACRSKRFPFTSCAAVWEWGGPSRTFILKLKNGTFLGLEKIIAAYLITHWHHLEWPMPDFIVPVPSPWPRFLRGGNDAASSIAEYAAQLLDRPCIYPLKRKSGSFSQSKIPLNLRMILSPSEFQLSLQDLLFNKTILLVDDYFATGATFKCCAHVLSQSFPKAIYALAACYDSNWKSKN